MAGIVERDAFSGTSNPLTGADGWTITQGTGFLETGGIAFPKSYSATQGMLWSNLWTADHRAQFTLKGSILNPFAIVVRAQGLDSTSDRYLVTFTPGAAVAPAFDIPDLITVTKLVSTVSTPITPTNTPDAVSEYFPVIVGNAVSLNGHRLAADDVIEVLIADSQLVVRLNHVPVLHEEITGVDAAGYVGLISYAGASSTQGYDTFKANDCVARYVNKNTGSDSNSGLLAAPWVSLRKGVAYQAIGEFVFVTGSFGETVFTYNLATQVGQAARTATSMEDPISVWAKAGDTVTNTVSKGAFHSIAPFSFWSFLNMNVVSTAAGTEPAVKIWNGSRPFQYVGGSIKGCANQGIHLPSSSGDFTGGNVIRHVNLHGNGHTDFQVHNVYAETQSNVVEYCRVNGTAYHASKPTLGLGLQLYYSVGVVSTSTSGTIARFNVVHGHTGAGGSAGILMGRGTGNQVYSNLSYGNSRGIDVDYHCVNTLVYNNVTYDNTIGIVVGTQTTTTNTQVHFNTVTANVTGLWNNVNAVGTDAINNILYGNTTNIDDDAGDLTSTTNVTTDPSFVDAANDDYQILSGSVAATGGTDLTGTVPMVDFFGRARPQQASTGRGAYEYPNPPENDPTVFVTAAQTLQVLIATALAGVSLADDDGDIVQFMVDSSADLTVTLTASGTASVIVSNS